MASTYGKLLLAVYELEGLLLVLEKHGDDTPASVVELIKQKAAFVAEEAKNVEFPQQPVEEEMLDAALDEPNGELEHPAEEQPVEENVVDEQPEEDEVAEDATAVLPPVEDEIPLDEPEEIEFVEEATQELEQVEEPEDVVEEVGDDEEPPEFVKCPQCGKVLPMGYAFCNDCGCPLGGDPQNAPEEDAAPIDDEDADFVVENAEATEPAPEAEVEVEVPADDISFAEEEEVFEEVETEEEEEIVDDEVYTDDEELSIEEKLHRGIAKNMRSAFSLNDSIRFRRELFGNSQAEYNDALDMVQSMHSFGEAEEYFYDDLAWDPMNEEVNAFMEVVRKHLP
ncbi:MAG: zinc ribbon domain-containing protein [Muribaculaceae bacterium]|nr:zinc ribbon domain-containing protein [Muribaculaceae bacterium]